MTPGQDVREVITGKTGVVVGDLGSAQYVLFPSIKGNLNLDGTYDSGVRPIPNEMLEEYRPQVDLIMEAVNNVLQAQG